jgi:3-hydroxyisobutyrate dehydrogenase-like beta-hydroxyacid dehydrogenase
MVRKCPQIIRSLNFSWSDVMHAVTVIGLGAMGVTLARLFQNRGRQVTVRNRSAAKAAVLEDVAIAPSAAATVAASPLVMMCVYDYAAARQILAQPGVAEALTGKTLVQLTTGSPADALDAAEWAAAHGVAYLDGAIQAAPSQMGQTDTPILISGIPRRWRNGSPCSTTYAATTPTRASSPMPRRG